MVAPVLNRAAEKFDNAPPTIPFLLVTAITSLLFIKKNTLKPAKNKPKKGCLEALKGSHQQLQIQLKECQ